MPGKNLSVYLAHPISGLTFGEVMEYYTVNVMKLRKLDLTVFDPVTMYIDKIPANEVCAPHGLLDPLTEDHALFERDKWIVTHKVDVVLADLTGAKKASIGVTMELAWASQKDVHTVVVMTKDNPMHHGFVIQAADLVLETMDQALDYLGKMNA